MTLSGLLNGDTFSVQHIVAPKNTVFTSLQLNQDVMSRTGSKFLYLLIKHFNIYIKGHLKIMIACGPFALNSCTEFGIFDRLMSQVVEQSVNVLILVYSDYN
jgi:hypothetical protein